MSTVDQKIGLVWTAHPKLLQLKVKSSSKICLKLPNLGLGGVSMPSGTISAHHGRRVSPDVISGGSCALEEVWDKSLNLAGPQKKTEKSILVQLTCFRGSV